MLTSNGVDVDDDRVPQVIHSLLSAMNTHDVDAAVAAVDPDIEILVGPHVLHGVEVIREFALQDDPALIIVNTAMSCEDVDDELRVQVQRVSHWREDGELSSREDLVMSFKLTPDGLVRWARIA